MKKMQDLWSIFHFLQKILYLRILPVIFKNIQEFLCILIQVDLIGTKYFVYSKSILDMHLFVGKWHAKTSTYMGN